MNNLTINESLQDLHDQVLTAIGGVPGDYEIRLGKHLYQKFTRQNPGSSMFHGSIVIHDDSLPVDMAYCGPLIKSPFLPVVLN